MILRRITEHVKAQNWFAVGIDFFIVVVGVFVGIQVSNWNVSQADQRRGSEYADRVVRDLITDLQRMRGSVSYYDAVIESAETTLRLLNDTSSDNEALVFNAYRATETIYLPQTRATWDEIVSSGEIGLLPRAAVEGGLVWYFSLDVAREMNGYMIDSPFRTRVRRLIPHAVQQALRANCSDKLDFGSKIISLDGECALDLPDALIDEAANALRTDDALIGDLRSHFSVLSAGNRNQSGAAATLFHVISLLEGEASAEIIAEEG